MTKSLSGYEHADSVLTELQTSKLHEKQKERQLRSARNIDPPNFRPLMKRKYSSGKLSSLNNNNNVDVDDIDINGISPTTTNNNRRREETTFQFKQNDHPDDESSTFIRAKTFILVRYIKQFILPCYSRIRHLYYRIEQLIKNRIDIKKIGLVILVGLVFVFMKVGLENETYPTSYSGGYESSYRGSNSIQQQQTTYITGYQASSQVPIPVEYSNFVELGEFVNAVTLIRMHREQQMQQQQQQNENGGRIRHRRLEEGDDKEEDKKEDDKDDAEGAKEDAQEDAKEDAQEEDLEDKVANDETKDGEDSKSKEDSADELDNVVDKAWEKAIQKNPEMGKQKQKANLLKVYHVPFFWHIPRTGGTTLSTLLSTCHNLVQATSSFSSPPVRTRELDDAAFASRFRDPTLYVVRTHGQQFVNVDLDSYEGVQRAVKGELIEKELADVLVVPDVRLGGLLFGSDNNEQQQQQVESGKKEYKGVLFAMFRHPIDRAVSLFYHKQNVKDSIHYDPTLEASSLQEWINGPSYVTDYMVRTLVGKIDQSPTDAFHIPVPLTPSDLDVAKEILRRKCIIGLLEEKGESMKRFDKFFGWRVDVSRDSLLLFEEDEKTAHAKHAARWSKNVKDEECSDKLLHWNWMNKNKHPSLDEGSVVFNLLESKNRYDMELYMYARQLFEEQFFQLGFDDDTINDNEVEWGQ